MRILTALVVLATPTLALAEGPFEGTWRAGAMEIRNEIGSWGADCPQRLPPTQTEPGGEVRITQSGDQLTFAGAVRGGTNRCWSDQPGLRRVSSTYQEGRWTTICRTPSEVAQGENGTYTWRASGETTLSYEETTRWDWRLNTSHCVATRTARRTLTRVGAAPVVETPPPTMEPEPAPERCTPGAPARLRVSALDPIAPGDRACVRARVVDASGCTVPNAPIEVSLEGEARGRLEGRCFVAAAAGSEGAVRLAVSSGAFREVVSLRVETEDLTDLTARRLREAGEAQTGPQNAEAEGASGVAARALAGDPGALAWVGGGVALLVLAGIVVLVLARKKPAPVPPADTEDDAPPRPSAAAPVASAAPAPPTRKLCPTCGRETEGKEFCPHDGARLLDPEDPKLRAQGMICPTCRRGYPADVRTCAQDGDELMPYAMFVARQKVVAPAAKKICPKCGTTYDPETTFCGKDGSPLQTVN
ncbi:MAG: hypothetical protein R3B99_06385 [Polyangiales bacterium]